MILPRRLGPPPERLLINDQFRRDLVEFLALARLAITEDLRNEARNFRLRPEFSEYANRVLDEAPKRRDRK